MNFHLWGINFPAFSSQARLGQEEETRTAEIQLAPWQLRRWKSYSTNLDISLDSILIYNIYYSIYYYWCFYLYYTIFYYIIFYIIIYNSDCMYIYTYIYIYIYTHISACFGFGNFLGTSIFARKNCAVAVFFSDPLRPWNWSARRSCWELRRRRQAASGVSGE